MSLPWENSRSRLLVPKTTSMPSAPVSMASLASSMWQRTWVRILVFSPRLAMRSRSARLCGLAAGEVSSMYSTPNASSRRAISTFWSEVEKGVGELLALAQGGFDDGKTVETHDGRSLIGKHQLTT
jgi:hypothetical protein